MGRVLLLLTCCTCAFALNPDLDVSQYAHTPWKIRDGFTKGEIFTFAQTPDGYLWLGTEFGLLCFDGVKNVPWQPPSNQALPSSYISKLLAARDGTLWIGTYKGLASWKDGQLTQYPELAGQKISAVLEDREGSVWAGVLATPTGTLCAIQKGGIQCHGVDPSLGLGVFALFEDGKGSLWAGGLKGLWRWKPGPPKFYPLPPEPNGLQGLAEADDGALLVTMPGGVRRVVEGKEEMAYPFPASLRQVQAHRILRDRDGGLWIGTSGRGLVHVHQGRTDVFAQADGLSGDFVNALFEDREGNIWVATSGGLDRFRDFAVATLSVNQGLSNARVNSVLTTMDGSVRAGTSDGLDRWNHGQVTVYRERSGQTQPGVREVTGKGLPEQGVQSLFQDDRGRVWVATRRDVGYLENERFTTISGVPGINPNFNTSSIVGDTVGGVWMANTEHGLLHIPPGGGVEQVPWASLNRKDAATALLADSRRGGLWLGFFQGGVAYFADGRVRASYSAADGLGEGRVADLRLDREGALWAATEGGLSRIKDGRVATLSSKNGLPCDAVHWSMEDDIHSVWMYTACGLLRIARPELDAWAAAEDKNEGPMRTIKATVFENSDGVISGAGPLGYSRPAAKSADGRLWFATTDGLSVVDPSHLPFNKLPPPVQIETIIADRKSYSTDAALKLPPLTRDLEIDYTARSLVDPEKNRFRVKLEGRDRDWQDMGDERKKSYNDLPPRQYRFRVMASNNSGVWSEAGASFDFSVAPAYYQTTWFQASCVAAFLALLGGLYQLRVKQVERHLSIRMEERINERTRIARDLHDTLLQSFQGVLLKFYAATFKLPDETSRTEFEIVIEQARSAIAEGRDAVQGLRASGSGTNDLALAMGKVGQELASHDNGAEFDLQVVGEPRELVPIVRDEAYRIGCEALRNAFRHAQAKRIEAEIQYEPRRLQLRVRDNGKGIDPKILKEGNRAGHHGLPGMHERAKLVGGKLAVWSELNSGAEIELTIPGSVAYPKKATETENKNNG